MTQFRIQKTSVFHLKLKKRISEIRLNLSCVQELTLTFVDTLLSEEIIPSSTPTQSR